MNSLSNSVERWNRFYREQSAMLLSASEVFGKRTAGMAAHGVNPNATELNEMHTMIAEKQAALFEGAMAAWVESMRAAQSLWLDTLRVGGGSFPASSIDSPLRIMRAAVKPMHSRVSANRKRLAR